MNTCNMADCDYCVYISSDFGLFRRVCNMWRMEGSGCFRPMYVVSNMRFPVVIGSLIVLH